MAKQPEIIERYKIHCETSVEQMGRVLAMLTRLGVENVGYELITDVLNYKNRGRSQTTTVVEAITEWIKTNPTFAINEAVKHFGAEGRTPGSVYMAIATMVKAGVLKRLEGKNYAVAGMKAIAPPKAKTKVAAAPKRAKSVTREKSKQLSVSGLDAVRAFVRPRKLITPQQVMEHFDKQGRNRKSVSPILHQLVILGEIKHGENKAEYIVVKNVKTKTSTNGVAAPSTEQEHANG